MYELVRGTSKRKRAVDQDHDSHSYPKFSGHRPSPWSPSASIPHVPPWRAGGVTLVREQLQAPQGLDFTARPKLERSNSTQGNSANIARVFKVHTTGSQELSVNTKATSSQQPAKSQALPQISDQDSHLIDFPDIPPETGGGSCELYIAFYRPDNLKLAMKRPKVDFPTDDMLRRFRREAEIWSTFKHPNILPFLGTLKLRHRIYIASPWMSLGDLLVFVQTRVRLLQQGKGRSDESIPLVYSNFSETKIIQEIAAGLEYLHSTGVIHGDMKAKNILLTDSGHAQICDFGLAKTLDHAVTSTDVKGVGSLRWQSPELLHNSPKSPKSDIYALGMTIAEVLTGDYPFPHFKEPTSVLCAVVLRNERPAFWPLSRLEVDFRPLWELAAWCWKTSAEERPVMREVLQQLQLIELHPRDLHSGASPLSPHPRRAQDYHKHRYDVPLHRLGAGLLSQTELTTNHTDRGVTKNLEELLPQPPRILGSHTTAVSTGLTDCSQNSGPPPDSLKQSIAAAGVKHSPALSLQQYLSTEDSPNPSLLGSRAIWTGKISQIRFEGKPFQMRVRATGYGPVESSQNVSLPDILEFHQADLRSYDHGSLVKSNPSSLLMFDALAGPGTLANEEYLSSIVAPFSANDLGVPIFFPVVDGPAGTGMFLYAWQDWNGQDRLVAKVFSTIPIPDFLSHALV